MNHTDYQIAIPSYRRPDVKTLATLERMGVDFGRVTIFVSDEEERVIYEAQGTRGARVVVGVRGLLNQRIFYNRYYPEGTPLLNVDDDLHELLTFTPDGKKLRPAPYRMDDVVAHGFGVCASVGARLWGICAVQNAFYMGKTTSVGLRYICGIFHGSYAGDVALCGGGRTVSSGEDFETTLRSFRRYGATVRLDWLCPKTVYFAKGGIQAEIGGDAARRNVEHTAELHAIHRRHPDLCATYVKAGSVTNLRLARFPVTHVAPPPFTGL